MRILGILSHHDSSVCLIEDGKLLRFYKEERLARVKREFPPIKCLTEIYNEFGDTIDYFVGEFHDTCKTLQERFFPSVKDWLDVDHHQQHASLAFYDSGFKDAIAIIVDRNGEKAPGVCESESVYHCSYPNNIHPVYKCYNKDWYGRYFNSEVFKIDINQIISKQSQRYPECHFAIESYFNICSVYESAIALINEHPMEAGKVMGLASYGKSFPTSRLIGSDSIPIDSNFHTRHIFDIKWGSNATGNHPYTINRELDSKSTKTITQDNYQLYADYAHQVQCETQQALGDLIERYAHLSDNICISGGYGLNVVANQYLTERFPWKSFYFEPLADDSGNSLGSALMLHHEITGSMEPFDFKDTMCHGKEYPIPKEYKTCELDFIVDSLCNDKSVAVFHKQAEAGPRALGNRSILFNPYNPDAKEIVNKIKKREWYRPFAAMVLDYEAPYIFNIGNHEINERNYKYMTRSVTVRDPFLYGVTHVDQTCRIQTIDYKHHLYRLLRSISSRIGYGVLLNTSFNLAGEPLVETLADAEKTFYNSDLDILWFPETNQFISKD